MMFDGANAAGGANRATGSQGSAGASPAGGMGGAVGGDGANEPLVLVVNPGSTSTKLGLYRGEEEVFQEEVLHLDKDLAPFTGAPILAQLPVRLDAVWTALRRRKMDVERFAAVSGRGGLLPPLRSGTYQVDEGMLQELRLARRGEHASNLGAFLARELAAPAGCPAFVVDPVSVDEWDDVARLSGLVGLDRECLSHALNSKAVAKRYAREQGKRYNRLRLIVVHLGSGTTVSAHREGQMVDSSNPREEGPFSIDRSGGLPVLAFARFIIESGNTIAEVERNVFREGGIYSYIGTRDLRHVLRLVDQGEEGARLVVDAMLYQVRKEIGAMAAVLEGRVDAILLTGGVMRAQRLADELARAVRWIAPVAVYPGEDELRALAEGALRVLRGEERPLRLAESVAAHAVAH